MSKQDYDLEIVAEDGPEGYKAGTTMDQKDMHRVGKTQELRVSAANVSWMRWLTV